MARLSLLIGNLGGGGAQGVCVTLANGLAAKGHRVEIVVLTLQDASRLGDVSDDVKVVDLNVSRARYAYRALTSHYQRTEPDTVLVFVVELWFLLTVARWRNSGSYRLVARTINTLSAVASHSPSWLRRVAADRALKHLYSRADHVVAQSSTMADELNRVYRVPDSRLSVIPNPVSPRYLLPQCADEPVTLQSPYLLFVGRLERQKGLDRLLDAFKCVVEQKPEMQLAILGEGKLKTLLQKQAASLGIDNKVHFVGHQEHLLPWYCGAQATVLTSFYEGLPNVLIESIACGTPVVSFDCPSGPSDIITEGVNGMLVPQGNIEALAEALVSMICNPLNQERVRSTVSPFLPEEVVLRYESILLSGYP